MKDRKVYIDIIRIVAIYCVIINHTNWLFGSYHQIGNYTWGTSAVIYFIAKVGVPLFIMITGALSLGKEQSYTKIVMNITKIIALLLVWSGIYWVYQEKPVISVSYFITSVIDKPVRLHLWYLYTLAGLYMMIPFIQKMVKVFKPVDYYVYLTIWLLYTSLLPFLRIFKELSYTPFVSIPLFFGFSGYLVLGHFIANINLTKKVIYTARISLVASLALILIVTYRFSSIAGKTSNILDNNLAFPVVIISASLFLLIKYRITKNKIWTKPNVVEILSNLSKNTFGIYLIHVIVKDVFKDGIFYNFLFYDFLNPVIGLLIYGVFVMLLSYIITVLIGKIPYVKKIVYF